MANESIRQLTTAMTSGKSKSGAVKPVGGDGTIRSLTHGLTSGAVKSKAVQTSYTPPAAVTTYKATYKPKIKSEEDRKNRIKEINTELGILNTQLSSPDFGVTDLKEMREANKRKEGLELELKTLKAEKKFLNDKNERTGKVGDWVDRAESNLDIGRLSENESAAWDAYLTNPTKENREYAENLGKIREAYEQNNKEILKEKGWLSTSVAGYLPQFWNQLGAQATGAAAGAAAGSLVGPAGVIKGAKAGAVAATGAHSFKTMRGAAFKALLNEGVSEDIARKAASDEAVVSALIEMADTGLDIATFGKFSAVKAALGQKAVSAAGKTALGKAASALAPYVGNILGEAAEEAAQEAVSIKNIERAKEGKTGVWELAKAAPAVVTDKEGRKQMAQAAWEGAKIAAFGVGLDAVHAGGNKVVEDRVVSNEGDKVRSAGESDQLVADALTYFTDESESYKTALKWRQEIKSGERTDYTSLEIGQLNRMMQQDRKDGKILESKKAELAKKTEERTKTQQLTEMAENAQNPEEQQYAAAQLEHTEETVVSPVAQEIMDAGIAPDIAVDQAELIRKVSNGEHLTNKETKALKLTDPVVRAAFTKATGVEISDADARSSSAARKIIRSAEEVAAQTKATEAVTKAQQQIETEQRQAEAKEAATTMLNDAVAAEEQSRAAAASETPVQQNSRLGAAFNDIAAMNSADPDAMNIYQPGPGAASSNDKTVRHSVEKKQKTGKKKKPIVSKTEVDEQHKRVVESESQPESQPESQEAKQETGRRELTPKGSTRITLDRLNSFAKKRGLTVKYGDLGKDSGSNAFYDKSSKTIWLNHKKATDQRSMTRYFAHEITHATKDTDSKLILNDLYEVAKDIKTAKTVHELVQKRLNTYRAFYLDRGEVDKAKDFTEMDAREEVMADFIMEAVGDVKVLDKLTGNKPKLTMRMLDHLQLMINKGKRDGVDVRALEKLVKRMNDSLLRVATSELTKSTNSGKINTNTEEVQHNADSAENAENRGSDHRGRQDTGRTDQHDLRVGSGSRDESGRLYGRGDLGNHVGTLIPEKTRTIMNDKGIPDVGLTETTDRGAFSVALDKAKGANPNGGMVDGQSVEGLEQSGAKTFMRSDCLAGVAVESDGNIVGVFKHPDLKMRNSVMDLILSAIAQGGDHLDCYATYGRDDLRRKYSQLGFMPVAWLEFNREYAPDGWNYDAWGEPDVVMWVHNGDTVEEIVSRDEPYHTYTKEEIHALPRFTDYDEAKAYQKKRLDEVKAKKADVRFSINPEYATDVEIWDREGRPSGEIFHLGTTSDVLQGLGAQESDITMDGDKIVKILAEHPEISIDTVKKIPQILEDPVLILKSRNTGGNNTYNSRVIVMGTEKGSDGRPVMAAFDLRPTENHMALEGIQRVASAYTKDNNPTWFVENSYVLYADEKRATRLLRSMGFQMPIKLHKGGFLGSINYFQRSVNSYGTKFNDVFEKKTPEIRHSIDSDGKKLTPEQQEFFKDSKVRDEQGRLTPVYHGTPAGGFTEFKLPEYLSVLMSARGAGFYFTDKKNASQYTKPLNGKTSGKKQLYKVYLNITNPLVIAEDSPVSITKEQFKEIIRRGNYGWFRTNGLPHQLRGDTATNKTLPFEEQLDKWADQIFRGALYDEDILNETVRAYKGGTPEILENMKDILGYDGVRYMDKHGDIWVAWSSNQIKNTTNKKPTEDPDIRFSIDSTGRELSAEQQEFFKDSKVRDEQGRLIKMYHGTNHPGFTVFDPAKSDDKTSLFFTSSPAVANTYTELRDNGSDLDPYNILTADSSVEEVNAAMERIESPVRIEKLSREWADGMFDIFAEKREKAWSAVNAYLDALEKSGKSGAMIVGFIRDAGRIDPELSSSELVHLLRDVSELDRLQNARKEYWAAYGLVQDMYASSHLVHVNPDDYGKYVVVDRSGDQPQLVLEGGNRASYAPNGLDEKEAVSVVVTAGKYDAQINTGNRYPVYLNLTNPYIIDAGSDVSGEYNLVSFYGRNGVFILSFDSEAEVFELKFDREEAEEHFQKMFDEKVYAEILSEIRAAEDAYLDEWGDLDTDEVYYEFAVEDVTVNYSIPGVWNKLNLNGQRAKTRDVAAYAKANGYDGVIFKNMKDTGGYAKHDPGASTVAVAFNSNQVKATSNKNPTVDPDLRYSLDPATGYEEGSVQDRLLKLLETADFESAVEELNRWAHEIRTGNISAMPEEAGFISAVLSGRPLTPAEAAQNRIVLNAMIKQSGLMDAGENPARTVLLPNESLEGRKTSKYARTVAEAPVTPDWMVDEIERGVGTGEAGFTYEVVTDKAAMKYVEECKRREPHVNFAIWDEMIRKGKGSGIGGTFSKKDIAFGEYLYTQAVADRDAVTATKLVAEIAAIGTQAGQTVQAMRLLKKMSPAGQLYYVQKAVENLNRKLKERGHTDLLYIDIGLAEDVLNAKTQEEIDAAVEKLIGNIAEQAPVTLMDKWDTWRYLAMLGNPRTHIRNIVSNAVFAPVTFLKDLVATGIESKVIKDPAQRTKALGWKKYDEFAEADFKQVEATITGTGKQNISDQIRDRRQIFKSKPGKVINKLSDKNSEWMNKEDAWFLKPAYKRALGQFLAAHNADTDDLTNTAPGRALLEQARDYAIAEAQKATFRDASVLASAISQFENHNLTTKFIAGSLMPFKKTPINILKRGVEYSPVGLLDTLIRGSKQLRNGEITTSEYIDRISAGLTGTSIMALGLAMTARGLLRGGDSGDDKEDAFDELQGAQTYSIVLGDMSFTIDWMAPAALPLFIGYEVYNRFTEKGLKALTVAELSDTMMNLANPMFQLSMLDGLNSTFKAASYGDNAVYEIGTNMLTSYVSQGVPTIAGQVARTIDGTRRSAYVEKGTSAPFISRFAQNTMAKTPGLSKNLTPRLDAWGRIDTEGRVWLRALENFILPGYVSFANTSPMETELDRLYKVTGNSAVLPKSMSKYFNVDKVRHDLSADEWERYQTVAGQTAYSMLSDLVNSPAYRSLTDAQKADAVEDIFTYAKEKGKSAAVPGYTDAPSWIGKADDMSKRGFSVDEYVVQRIYSNGTDGGSTQDVLSMSWLSDTDRANLISDGYGKKLTKNTFSDPNRSGYIYSLTDAQVEQYEQYFETQWQAEYVQLTGSTRYLNADIETRAKMIDDLKSSVADGTKKWMARQLRSEGVRSTKKD